MHKPKQGCGTDRMFESITLQDSEAAGNTEPWLPPEQFVRLIKGIMCILVRHCLGQSVDRDIQANLSIALIF